MKIVAYLLIVFIALAVNGSIAIGPIPGEIVSSSASDLNGVHGTTSLILDTLTNHLYICYIDSDLRVMIADRSLTSSVYRFSLVAATNVDDAHNGCAIGLDSLGYIHIAYNMHSTALNYKRSAFPYDPTSLNLYPMPVVSSAITYPMFVRSGNTLLFFYRTGVAGNANECLNRLDSSQWTVIACPLINGMGISSPYLAVPKVDSKGNVHILWTLRTSYFNYGLFTAIYNPSTNSFQDIYSANQSLPLLGEVVLSSANRVSNVGMNLLPEIQSDLNHRLVTYLGERGPTWEVFIANSNGLAWSYRQLSNEKAPRLRMCAANLEVAEPRACDIQIQAPSLIKLDSGEILLVYSRSVAQPRGEWARSAARLLASKSINGLVWTESQEIPFTPPIYCETVEEANGLPYLLAQDCTNEDGVLRLYFPERLEEWAEIWPISELDPYEVSVTAPIEISDSSWMTSNRFVWDFTLSPSSSTVPLGLLDKSYLAGDREYRVILWGYVNQSGSFVYSSDHMQIALGDLNGNWSLLWYPQVLIEPNIWTDLRIEWNGQVVSLYKDNDLIDSIAYAGTLKDTSVKLIVGGVRSSVTGQIARPYSGILKVTMH